MSSKTAHLAIVSLATALSACGGGDSSVAPPVTTPSVATSVTASSSTAFTGTPGEAVTELPSVIVKDQRGAAMSGVVVTFAVTGGGGTITGSSVTTNTSGVARVGGWTLGAEPGPNSLTASTSGLSLVTFIATAVTCASDGSGITCALLPTLGGASSQALAINDAGIVVGYSADNTPDLPSAVRWTPTSSGSWSITRIAGPNALARAVNLNGAAVGVRDGRGKLWPAAGGEIDLGPHLPSGINSAETIVGFRIPNLGANQSQRAVVWTKPSAGWNLSAENAPQDLRVFPGGAGETGAGAINEAGVIVGAVAVDNGSGLVGYQGVRWDPVGAQWGEPTALPGAQSNFVTAARAINDNAQADIAGHIRACSGCGVFGILWRPGSSATSLEPFFGGALGLVYGINNAQRAVGFRETSTDTRAYVWWPGRTSLQVLSGPPSWDTWAQDINNASPAQAVGYGVGTNAIRAIVWMIP